MSDASYGRIGAYEIRGLLGRGGMATVYRAYSPSLRREVAIKVVTAPEEKLELLRERFRREAQTIGRLKHPHILGLLDSGEEHGAPYLVMDLIEGGALNSRLGQPLPPHEAIAIAQQIGRALDYAHAQGIIHRDVKPANIFLQRDIRDTRALLADFGIAKVLGELGPRLTQTGAGVGTPEYIAPEQAVGAAIDGRSDLYSLGVVLYEMLTGKPPYQGGPMEVINAHVQGHLPDPRTRNPALSPAMSAVLVKALARDPEQRYGSGAALTAALADALTGTRTVAQPQPSADAPSPTMLLQQTREMLLRTQLHQHRPADSIDATAFAPSPAITPPPKPAPPAAPSALPAVPTQPTGPPGAHEAARGNTSLPDVMRNTSVPEPPRRLPPTPLAARAPITQHPEAGQHDRTVVSAQPTMPPSTAPPTLLQQPTQFTPPTQAAPAPPYQAPMHFAPPTPPPPPAAKRGNLPLLIGLGAALVVLLVLAGVGGVYLVRRDTNTTPTVTAVAAPPTIATAAAAGSGTPVASTTGITPTVPARASTATAALAADPARAQIAAGEAALQEGQFTQAVATYKSALATNPQSGVANRQLGLALWIWNHEPGEIGYPRSGDQDRPERCPGLGLPLLLLGRYPSGGALLCRRPTRRRGQRPASRGLRGDRQLLHPLPTRTGQPRERQTRSATGDRSREATRPEQSLGPLGRAHRPHQRRQHRGGARPARSVIALRPNWATLYYAKGGLYSALDRPAEAKEWQERALAIDPEYPYALTELGWLAFNEGNYPSAKEFFNRALVLTDDTNDSAHIGLGYTLLREGDSANALLHCQRATGIDTRLPGGFNCLGEIYRVGTRQYPEALAAYRKVLELRPYWEDGHVGTALVQAAQGNYVAAEGTLKQGLIQITKPRYVHYWLGWVQYQERKYDEAQPNFEQAAKLVPNYPDLHYQMGQNLEQLQRYPEARVAYERALTIDPNYAEAQQALERLRQQGR